MSTGFGQDTERFGKSILRPLRNVVWAKAHDVMDYAGKLHSAFAGHDSELADAPTGVISKTVYSAGPLFKQSDKK